jgi:acetyl esterase/lipase
MPCEESGVDLPNHGPVRVTKGTHNNVRSAPLYLLLILALVGCAPREIRPASTASLADARRGFRTVVTPQAGLREPVEQAPPGVFRTVRYPAPSGQLAAYLSPDPGDGRRHPAIIWITGGDCNSIGDVWSPAPPENDQTAAAYRKAGIVMMFPSLRGGNDNPGVKEGFLGEVDDVLAAADYLEKQGYVDPKRIYLGGHSTGGTLVLLAAEASGRFRGVFSFGPIDDVSNYGSDPDLLPSDMTNRREVELRSPGYWLHSARSPVWVIEGRSGNTDALRAMARSSKNPLVRFIKVRSADHFSVLAPANEIIAGKILRDTGDVSSLSLTQEEVNRGFGG